MAEYQAPDRVLLMIGASFRAAPLREAALRFADLLKDDASSLKPFGVGADAEKKLRAAAEQLRVALSDAALSKNDTPFQMSEIPETMAEIRRWLNELRQLATINLTLDRPALQSVISHAPEVADGYPRDLLEELDSRMRAALSLKERIEDVGVDDAFMKRGRRLYNKLKTAIGAKDLDGGDLQFKVRRFYLQKARLYRLLKRTQRAGRYAFRHKPKRARLYHLEEIEPRKAKT